MQNQMVVKGVIAGTTAGIIDQFYFKSNSMKNTLILASCVGVSSIVSNYALSKNLIPDMTNGSYDSATFNTKTVESRILEMGLSMSSAYLVNTMVLKNTKTNISMIDILILFGSSSFISEYASDYLYKRPLNYLS